MPVVNKVCSSRNAGGEDFSVCNGAIAYQSFVRDRGLSTKHNRC